MKRLLALAMVLALILSGLCDSRFQVLAKESTEAETEVLEEQESAEEEQKERERMATQHRLRQRAHFIRDIEIENFIV